MTIVLFTRIAIVDMHMSASTKHMVYNNNTTGELGSLILNYSIGRCYAHVVKDIVP